MGDSLNMGSGTSRIFSGQGTTETNKLHYGETASFFAEEIKKRLPISGEPYVLVDLGTFKGELLADILKLLPKYKFKTIGVDINEEALADNTVVDSKVVANAEKLPFNDRSIDIAIMRYVLQWNVIKVQKDILKDISRVIKRFALLEHNGPDNVHAQEWRKHSDGLLGGSRVAKMGRKNYFFASAEEIEKWMDESAVKYERLRNRIIKDYSNIYIERYQLDSQEAQTARDILGSMDYIEQTDWVIFSK
jgi:ubiquinone/menaquinone biosynthesis C-methylase UbiE